MTFAKSQFLIYNREFTAFEALLYHSVKGRSFLLAEDLFYAVFYLGSLVLKA
uniref:Uncharacterized protein n=1 Tax=Caldiarchaeum subterraneum TaxID=311458 RepID=E6N2S0_CALS0|nr:hypothetical protein HGMM_F01H02C33 [Candidatus Caldarchaeum subterraneum]